MGFLDNSGDIILDAVLTDTGRMRMAKGDGSFRIVKFALGDDEINYELYQKNHASGSAFYDLEILQTPILESFTDNAASMKSKLISIPRTNLLYLPIMAINEVVEGGIASRHADGVFYVAVDTDSEDELATDESGDSIPGILNGVNPTEAGHVRVDQGLNTSDISPKRSLGPEQFETQYQVQMDNRFGQPVTLGGLVGNESFVDDDNIANYFFSFAGGAGSPWVKRIASVAASNQVISGPRGTKLVFRVQAGLELNTSNALFDKLGNTVSITGVNGAKDYYAIDSTIRCTGVTTGYRLDIPVRYVKLK